MYLWCWELVDLAIGNVSLMLRWMRELVELTWLRAGRCPWCWGGCKGQSGSCRMRRHRHQKAITPFPSFVVAFDLGTSTSKVNTSPTSRKLLDLMINCSRKFSNKWWRLCLTIHHHGSISLTIDDRLLTELFTRDLASDNPLTTSSLVLQRNPTSPSPKLFYQKKIQSKKENRGGERELF